MCAKLTFNPRKFIGRPRHRKLSSDDPGYQEDTDFQICGTRADHFSTKLYIIKINSLHGRLWRLCQDVKDTKDGFSSKTYVFR
jgi:hypothetical protein